ncbi:hypothetical protein SS50377_23825 [Spironucleus salmonicida]|uniref:Uncharacterized protein n=1 Tax=Spironucleus salmonicida TaxID=348837 RepID=V6M052_9EUKA|nr:hypothetical protein SS50377_23825 [Spironucleus salmonicida]|eukprot:EST46504.1 Hypothetical protein SS50377_13585 [Spironucleus salmonicida]
MPSRSSRDHTKRVVNNQKTSSRHKHKLPVQEPSEQSSYYSYSYSQSPSPSPPAPKQQPSKSKRTSSTKKISPDDFGQIYSADDYQQLLRAYRELFSANEDVSAQLSTLTPLLQTLQQNQDTYVLQHAKEIQQITTQNKALEDQINEKFQAKIRAQEVEIRSLQQQAKGLASNTKSDAQSLKFSDLSMKLSKSESEMQNSFKEQIKMKQIINAYQLLTGVSISQTKKFSAPKAEKFTGYFVFGDPLDGKNFMGKVGYNDKKAAIECIRAPVGVKNVQNFLEGAQCEVGEMRYIFGQMCAEIVSQELQQ